MKRLPLRILFVALAVAATPALAQDLLIRNAHVHTAGPAGSLAATDVRIANGRIAAIGQGLAADGVTVIEAEGRPLTPALFGGISSLGLEEVSSEETTRDGALALGENAKDMVVRPEFDVSLAYNPDSVVIPVARMEGIGFSLLSVNTAPGGSIIGGQGSLVRLDGSPDPAGPKVLFVQLGGRASQLSGASRAGQWMLLDQLAEELAGNIPAHQALLTPAGRKALQHYFDGKGRIVFGVHRAADIRQLLRWSARHRLRIVISGGAEAWKLAAELAAAQVPVFLDPLDNLPGNFDQVNATLQNAARLHAAGVTVGFSQTGDSAHNARKQRQLAGNAVAHGLPWDAALAGLTRVPGETFGGDSHPGTLAVGNRADLVLWTGDPLDVGHTAVQVWLDGRAIPMRSRQTELRDRYLAPRPAPAAGGLPRAYPAGS